MDKLTALLVGGDPAGVDNEELLVQAAQRDPAAFGELYRRYLRRIYRYLRARTVDAEEAADLTQQVFLQALDALPGYRVRGLPFAAWLFRIARNVATDAYRSRRPQSALAWERLPESHQPASPDWGDDPEATLLQQEALGRLRGLWVQLKPEQRELLALRFGAGLTAREIGAVIGKREAAVHKQLARLLQALKEQYDEE